jgi:hypothetical protein
MGYILLRPVKSGYLRGYRSWTDPEYSDQPKSLSPSSIHRWIFTLANLIAVYPADLSPWLYQKAWYHLSLASFSCQKYKTRQRRQIRLRCRWLFKTWPFFNPPLSPSLQ